MRMDMERAKKNLAELSKDDLENIILLMLGEMSEECVPRFQTMFLSAFFAGQCFKNSAIADTLLDHYYQTFCDVFKD